MAFQSCPGIAELVFHFTSVSCPMANVLHFYKTGGSYTPTDIDVLATAGDDWAAASYLPLIHEGVTYLDATARGLENEIDSSSVDSGGTGPGTATGFALVNSNTFCATLRTGFTGKSARGRFYAMPTVEDSLENAAQFTSTYTAGVVAALLDLKTTLAADGWNMCVLSRVSGGVKRSTGIATLVTTVEARNNDVDSQRGRLIAGH